MENVDPPTVVVGENRENDPSSVQIEIDGNTVRNQSSTDDMTNAKKLKELNMLKIPEVAHDDPSINRIRSKSFKTQTNNNSIEERRFSHDAYGFNKNFFESNLNSGDSDQNYMRKSTENTRSQPYEENHIDVKPAKSLDSIIESPKMKLPKQHRVHEYPDKNLNHLSFVSDNTGILKYNDINLNNTLNERNPFGPKISSDLMVDQPIPGTPMDTVSELSNSFDSNISHTSLHDKTKPSRSSSEVQSTYDEHYINYPMSSNRIKLASQIIENFKEYETTDSTKMQLPPESRQSISNDRSRKSSDQTDNERKKRKRRGGDDDRRPSKQDAELLDDPESLMFRDGRRKIDMILCYEEDEQGVMTEAEAKRREQRKAFQENLVKEGLEMEIENKDQSFDEKTYFVKVHIPWRTESRYAEVMNMKLPVKRFITISVKAWENENREQREKNAIMNVIHAVRKIYHKFQDWIEYDHSLIEKEPSFHNSTAGGKPEEQFIVKDRCTSFNSAQRSLLVMQILLRTKYDESEKVGIRRLLNDGTYLACFPLHEGRFDKNHHTGICYDRRLLYLEWARPGTWYKKQPLCLVRKYFGDKIALYFCWLGFYTEMLVYPAIVGTICFIYGLLSMNSDDNIPTKEMCDEKGVGSTILCPLCDKACSYQKLHESCLFARITYLFDNPSTVFFAIFMSFWATTFLEIWKRKQSIIVWEWDLHNVDNDEEARPEFETSVKTFRTNPVTREKEPFMPYWQKASRFICTGSAVLFMICVVLAAVLGTIIYRISLVRVIYAGSDGLFRKHAKLLTTMTAATINLIIIMILTKIYHKLAITLTNIENPRTQTEYEDSYTFKIFVFEFMNFYSSLIYIAFFKGRFYDYPGDDIVRQSEFFRLKGDICDPAGCLSELCIQLAIIMVGKQVWNNFMEYLYPAFYNWWRQRQHKKETKDETHTHMAWEQDYHLQDPGRLALFDEYLEMIIQYGFVTLFVAAFPLAPLFALLNNVAEIRLDAYKMVSQARRPLAERVEDIGAWYGILKIITYIAVVSNAFVIAYTSDFIPRMVYKYVYSNTNTLEGYIDHSLSIFNTSDYKEEWGNKLEHDPDTCKYRGYRKPYNSTDPYGLSSNYWHVFAARLAFVVTFEHIVFILTAVMQFIIPDIPVELKTQIRREQLLAKEAKYQHGLMKARENEYEELLQALRDQNNNSRAGPPTVAGSWGRRISRMSDGLDAHIEIVNRAKKSVESTVWEVT